jgi:hypothetical protein
MGKRNFYRRWDRMDADDEWEMDFYRGVAEARRIQKRELARGGVMEACGERGGSWRTATVWGIGIFTADGTGFTRMGYLNSECGVRNFTTKFTESTKGEKVFPRMWLSA